MTSSKEPLRAIRIVGSILLCLAVAGFLVAKLGADQPLWLNARQQPVSVYLVVAGLAVLAVIGLLDRLVWRKQRKHKPRHAARS